MSEHPFGGKFVEIIGKCSPSHSEFRENVELRTVAGRGFLVERDVQEGFDRFGLEVWIAPDDVAQFALSEDMAEMNARKAAYRKRLESQ